MRRFFVVIVVLVMVLPSLAAAKKPAMGQWGFTYGIFNNDFPGRMKDFHVAGFQFYFPVSRHVAIGPSGYSNMLESSWPKLPNEEGFDCDYWQASLDVKISSFPAYFLNPYLIFHLGAYDLKVEDTFEGNSYANKDLVNEGTHIFLGGTFGLEVSLGQFVIGARTTAMTYEKLMMDPDPHTQTDVNLMYTAFVGFHFKL